MKYTSAQANKLFRKLNEEYESLCLNERESYLFVASLGEDAESVRPQYDYREVQNHLDELEEKMRKLKHALNQFNATTVVPEFQITIDEMLVYIPQLTRRANKLATMKNRLPKTRVQQRYSNNIIDYEYINYDLETVRKDYEEVSDRLTRAQLALDAVNNTETFELDI